MNFIDTLKSVELVKKILISSKPYTQIDREL